MNPFTKILRTLIGDDKDAVNLQIPPEWLVAIDEQAPCGQALDDDTEYCVLQTRLAPKADVQYGSFVAQPPALDWKEIERDCRRLLLRSKDITVFVWFMRARSNVNGAIGLLEGLVGLQHVLMSFEKDVHPQIEFEGVKDPAVRANALEALCDPDGLLADIRDIVIASSTALRLTVRDVERAFAVPRPAYALDLEMVRRQMDDLLQKKDVTLLALTACAKCSDSIDAWAKQSLQEDAPNLQPLLKLLSVFLPSTKDSGQAKLKIGNAVVKVKKVETRDTSHVDEQRMVDTLPVLGGADQREQIRLSLIQLREWIEYNEPSSPVVVLLRQAERMWGKRFSEVADQIPPELLRNWDQD